MALSTATLTVTDFWDDGKKEHVVGTVAISASPGTYAAGGLALSLKDYKIKSTRAPKWVVLKGLSVEFNYKYVASSGKILITDEDQTSGVTAELATAATPAGVSGDVIDFYAIFEKLR